MPDFDQFERIIVKAMTVDPKYLPSLARDISSILKPNKPELFKNLSQHEVMEWIAIARSYLESLGHSYDLLEHDDSNMKGMDLKNTKTQQDIELKTGKVTDANLGVGTIAWAFSDSATLKKIMTDPMSARRDLFLRSEFREIYLSKLDTMIRLEGFFRQNIQTNEPVPLRLEHLVRCIARGITKLKYIKPLFGSKEDTWPSSLILHADRYKGWIKAHHPFHLEEPIVVKSMASPSNAESSALNDHRQSVPRAQAILRGITSNRTAQIYPNFKNSYKLSGDRTVTIPAKYWVSTPCFHVWIDKDKANSY